MISFLASEENTKIPGPQPSDQLISNINFPQDKELAGRGCFVRPRNPAEGRAEAGELQLPARGQPGLGLGLVGA